MTSTDNNTNAALLIQSLESMIVYALAPNKVEVQRDLKISDKGIKELRITAFISHTTLGGSEIDFALNIYMQAGAETLCTLEDRSLGVTYTLPVAGRAYTALMEKVENEGISGDDIFQYV